MISYIAGSNLRKMGIQRELKLFNQHVAPYCNSVEKYLAYLICRFSWDTKCPVMFIRLPQEGDEPIEGVKILRDMTYDEFLDVYNKAVALTLATFGEYVGVCKIPETKIVVLTKTNFEKGVWDNYEWFFSGKDGISIPAK